MSGPQRGLRGPADERLTLALLDLAAEGRRPPCGEPGAADLFLSDDSETRLSVAGHCHGCPILAECEAAAVENRERFGVWAGVDRSGGGS